MVSTKLRKSRREWGVGSLELLCGGLGGCCYEVGCVFAYGMKFLVVFCWGVLLEKCVFLGKIGFKD